MANLFFDLSVTFQFMAGEKLWHAGAITVVNLIPLVALRGCRNLIGVPFIIINDFKDCTFAFPTRFRTLVS